MICIIKNEKKNSCKKHVVQSTLVMRTAKSRYGPDDLKKKTVAELKAILEMTGLETKGKKDD